jgi:hypothetical protein
MGNVTVLYNATQIEDYCSQADLDATMNSIDVTNLGSTTAESISDFPEWKINLSGFWDATIDGVLAPDAVTPGTKRNCTIVLTDAAAGTVSYAWTANAELGSWQIQTAPRAAKTFSCVLNLSGAPTRT